MIFPAGPKKKKIFKNLHQQQKISTKMTTWCIHSPPVSEFRPFYFRKRVSTMDVMEQLYNDAITQTKLLLSKINWFLKWSLEVKCIKYQSRTVIVESNDNCEVRNKISTKRHSWRSGLEVNCCTACREFNSRTEQMFIWPKDPEKESRAVYLLWVDS